MRQRRLHLFRFHHLKARAICQVPTLIRRLLIAPQRALELFRCLRNDEYILRGLVRVRYLNPTSSGASY